MGLLVVTIWKSDGGTTVPPIFRGNGHPAAWHKVAIATDPERSEGAIKKRSNYMIAVQTLLLMMLEQVLLFSFVFLYGDFKPSGAMFPILN